MFIIYIMGPNEGSPKRPSKECSIGLNDVPHDELQRLGNLPYERSHEVLERISINGHIR